MGSNSSVSSLVPCRTSSVEVLTQDPRPHPTLCKSYNKLPAITLVPLKVSEPFVLTSHLRSRYLFSLSGSSPILPVEDGEVSRHLVVQMGVKMFKVRSRRD